MSRVMAETPAPALGSLSDRVQLLRRDNGAEDEGGTPAVFVPIATVWARVRALSARPAELADGRAVSITHAVVLRFRTDMQPGDRVLFGDRRLDIVGADDLNGRRAYLRCLCSETRMTG